MKGVALIKLRWDRLPILVLFILKYVEDKDRNSNVPLRFFKLQVRWLHISSVIKLKLLLRTVVRITMDPSVN